MNRPQFPIGPQQIPDVVTAAQRTEALQILKDFPEKLKQVTHGLTDAQLEQPYRENSWTIRQLVHHISDSHNHSYNRMRWALTEDCPTIKAYDQDAFAKMDDYKTMPIDWSVKHIEIIHHKMIAILESLSNKDWQKQWVHPDRNKTFTIDQTAQMYAWHSEHHLAHIKNGLQ